ncbi:S-layer homology domain-containing protein [Sporosarcina sp. FSL K6-3457]|uniref:S-layer homology domain-containing protein n=1 Tax=Sporosarcina sp. FSL K6-3457 TaxID=2978204 RepID=UPI0030F6DBDC
MKVITKQPNEGKRLLVVLLSLMLVLSSALSVIGVPLTVQAATNTIYVSAEGVDTNPGTVDDPVATLNVARTKVSSPGTIILLSDITVAETQTMGQNKTVTVQSEEGATYSIIRSENFSDNFLISITSGTATFQNLIIDGNNVKATTHGINVIATAIFKDVIIQNHHNAGGGGVSVLSASTTSGSAGEVTITGSTQIRENTLSGRDEVNPPSILGAGSGGKLVIEGGLITDNEVKAGSNGVIVGLGLSGNPIFTMTDGKIEHNKLHGNGLNASGATVGNVAVYMRGSSAQARFEFGGTAYVHDNLDEDGEQRNVFLKNTAARDNAFLSLINAMEDGAKVGVYTNIMPTSAAPIVDVAIGYNGYTATALDAAYFFSDKASSAEIKFDGESDKVILAPVPPTLDKTLLKQSTVSGNQIILTFSDGVSLDDLTGFAIQVGGENAVGTLYEVDPNNPNQLILTLSEKPTADITLTYTGNDDGNLKGQNGMPVEDFNFDYPIDFVDELSITAPTGDPAQVTETRPEVKGTVTAGSKVDVVIKDKDGNVVTGAGGEATVTDGNWTFTPSVDLAVGDYTFEVTATSQDETSVVTKTQEITVDTTQYVDYTNTEEITNIDPNDVTYDETTDKFTVPSDVTEFTFKDGDKEKKATKNPTTGEWTFTEFVDHTPTGEITNINPNGVTYDKDTGKFEVPSDVTEFTFKDGDKEKKATKNPTTGEWTFTSTVNVPYESEQVGNISPEGITHNGTDEFTVPDDVEEFTFKDGDKEITATKDTDGNWTFTTTPTVDKVPLETKYDDVKDLNKSSYTSATWGPFETAIQKAEDVLNDPNATQAEVNKALQDLEDAHKALKQRPTTPPAPTVDKSLLEDQADEANGLSEDEYTPDSWNTFKDALTDAENVLKDPNATQQQVDDALDALKDAQDKLVPAPVAPAVDKSKLQAQADGANGLTEDQYTPDSWNTFKNALIAAENVLNDPDATQQQVDNALDALQDAQNKLVPVGTPAVDKSKLQAQADGANGLTEDQYTPDSWNKFKDALTAAENVLNNPDATQQQVDDALRALQQAQNNLVPIDVSTVDKSKLQAQVDRSNNLTESNYTTGSWNAFQNALTNAKNVLADPNATQQQVDAALASLIEARNALVPYTGGNGGGGGSDGSTSTPTPTPTPEGPKKETILVDLVIDGDHPIEKTPVTIERTRETNGDVNDRVILTLSNARDAVNKAIEIGNTVARIIIPDVADEVTQVTVDIPKQSIALLQANGIDLEIFTNNVWITIPQTSMDGIEDDFYFRLVPVKDANAREAIKIRAKAQQVVRDVMQNDDITVVARPMTIETNLSSRPVLITLPLRDVTLPTDPTDPTEREAFLKQLAVFIEHTDGERKVVFGEVVTMPDNTLGLRISVSKFSTFTIINVGKKEEVLLSHEAYIKGFEDGTFKPNQDVTRKQVALMIARNLGYVDGETTVQVAPFKDVAVDADGAGAIAYLKQLGIMNGDEHGYFNGGANMTRAQMAAVVANYKKLDVTEVPLSFTDTKNHWAQYAIEANREAGIITGFEDGTFKPQAHLTRAHAVKMINRMFDRGPLYGLDALHFSDVNEQHWAFEEIAEASTTHDYMLDAQQQEWLAK